MDCPQLTVAKCGIVCWQGKLGSATVGPSFDEHTALSTDLHAKALKLQFALIVQAPSFVRHEHSKSCLKSATVHKFELQIKNYLCIMGRAPVISVWSDEPCALWVFHLMEVRGMAKNDLKESFSERSRNSRTAYIKTRHVSAKQAKTSVAQCTVCCQSDRAQGR